MFRSSSEDEIQAVTVANPTVANYVRVTNDTGGAFRQVRLTLRSCPLTIADTGAFGSVLLATLPEGYVTSLGNLAKNLEFTTTSVLADTLNASVTVQWGLGTSPASASTPLNGTTMNLVPGVDRPVETFTSSATINVASTAVSKGMFDVDLYDGSAAGMPVYLNVYVPTGGDIDANATLLVSGTIVLTFVMTGDT